MGLEDDLAKVQNNLKDLNKILLNLKEAPNRVYRTKTLSHKLNLNKHIYNQISELFLLL